MVKVLAAVFWGAGLLALGFGHDSRAGLLFAGGLALMGCLVRWGKPAGRSEGVTGTAGGESPGGGQDASAGFEGSGGEFGGGGTSGGWGEADGDSADGGDGGSGGGDGGD